MNILKRVDEGSVLCFISKPIHLFWYTNLWHPAAFYRGEWCLGEAYIVMKIMGISLYEDGNINFYRILLLSSSGKYFFTNVAVIDQSGCVLNLHVREVL